MKVTLDNGLSVLLSPNRAAQVVAFQVWVQTGSADEAPDEAGIAHVFEHMLFKGTARRKVGQIAQEIEGAGGEINAWTSFDQTVYHIVLASRFFDTGLDVLSDAIFQSSFDPDELARELKVVLEEIKQGEDSPSRVVTQAMFQTAYTEHPYRRPVIGFEKVVRGFTRPKLLEFFSRWYVPENMCLVVCGDFEPEVALAKIRATFGAAPGRGMPRRPARHEPPQKSPRFTIVTQDVREAQLTFAYHIPGILHEDTPALDLAAIVVGQGDSSRLNLEVKRKRQLVTDVYGYTYTPRDLGLFVAGATLPPRGLEDTARAVLAEMVRLAREEITPEELTKARTVIESDTIYQKETVQGFARKLGFYETVAGGIGFEDEYHRRVQQVTPASLQKTVAKYVQPGQLSGALLLPTAASDKDKGKERAKKLRERLLEIVREVHAEPARPARRGPGLGPGAEVVKTTLPSGIRLLVKPDPTVPVLAVRAVWNGGLRFEDARTNGVNNLLGALITRGTRTRTAEEIMHEVEGMAGSVAGFSGRNSFGLRLELLSRHWQRGLEILVDCIKHPRFAEDELEKERRQVLDELHAQEDNLSTVAFRAFNEALYKKHPYRLDLLGTPDTVRAFTTKKLGDYYRRMYPAAELVIAAVGDIDPVAFGERIKTLLDGATTRLGGAPRIASEPARRLSDQPEMVTRHLPKQQAHLIVGFPGTTVGSPDRYSLEVLSTVLSGQGGRLFVELRDKQALAYRVSAFSLEGVDPGYFAVYMACSPENLPAARAGIDRELARMRDELVTPEELDRVKRYLVGGHDIGLQRRSALASTIAFHEAYGQGWDEYLRYAPGILAVSADEVRRTARHFLDPRKAVIALVTPETAQKKVVRKGRASKAARHD